MGLSVQLYSDSSPTFAHPNKRDSSQIDYFLMSPPAADLVANPPTILCHDLNTSDHNPVTITIKIPALRSCSPKTVASTRIVWNKMDKSRYQEVVVAQLAVTPISIASVADVWIAISSISAILHDSALKTSSPVKNRSKSNSLWTPTIKAAVSANRLAHFTWKMAGKPSDPLHNRLEPSCVIPTNSSAKPNARN